MSAGWVKEGRDAPGSLRHQQTYLHRTSQGTDGLFLAGSGIGASVSVLWHEGATHTHAHTTSCIFLALHSVKLLILSISSKFLLSQPSAGADLFALEGTHFAIRTPGTPKYVNSNARTETPSIFFFHLTLNCKLTAGQEIKPASHNCIPVCDST